MQFYLIDDDPAVINILRIIIEDGGYGGVCGAAASGVDALEDLRYARPDMVLVDLLMPGMDGIEFVRRARERYPDLHYIMLSQVTSKDMVAEAYDAGVDFFISKPVNSVEVAAVIARAGKLLTLDRTMAQMRALVQAEDRPAAGKMADSGERQRLGALDNVLRRLCARFSDSPKAMEQRIRRAATTGMVNLANMGIEDYANDTFTEYAGTLYHFEQVRREMDCIRGRGKAHGRVSVKRFLYALAGLCDRE